MHLTLVKQRNIQLHQPTKIQTLVTVSKSFKIIHHHPRFCGSVLQSVAFCKCLAVTLAATVCCALSEVMLLRDTYGSVRSLPTANHQGLLVGNTSLAGSIPPILYIKVYDLSYYMIPLPLLGFGLVLEGYSYNH